MSTKLDIVFQDRHLIAVNKPAGIPVGSEDSGDETLLEMLRAWNAERQDGGKKGYCVPIHFLDRPVSGAILFALSSKAASRLNEMFRAHKLTKIYWAVTESVPQADEGVLEHWLIKDHAANVTSVGGQGDRDAKLCKLSYRVLETSGSRALVEVRPVTGRSHQIRVQMAAIGCPLYGDKKYQAKTAWDGRIALHAVTLEINHPVGGAALKLIAPPPAEWKKQWKSFKTSL